MPTKTSHFDQQAPAYTRRAGLPQAACQRIAIAINQLSGAYPSVTLLDIGCGTGELGALLAKYFFRYVGLDFSLPMLRQFQATNLPKSIALIQANGNRSWPIADHSVNIFFSSRAIHWLDIKHTVNEAYRAAHTKKAMFIIGRAERDNACWESRLRKRCHQLLREHHLTPLNGNQHLKKLHAQLCNKEAKALPPEIVFRWHQNRTYHQSLADWANKPGLAGTTPSPAIKQKILSELSHWAQQQYGKNFPAQTERRYTLYPIQLHKT